MMLPLQPLSRFLFSFPMLRATVADSLIDVVDIPMEHHVINLAGYEVDFVRATLIKAHAFAVPRTFVLSL